MTFDVAPLPGFHPEIGLLLAALDDSTREWRESLGEPSIEAIVWQPAPDSYSIGGLILHLIDSEDYWFNTFAGGNDRDPAESELFLSEATDQFSGSWPIPPAQSISWYFDLQDRMRARGKEAIRSIEPEREFARRNSTCTLRWVVAHVLEHDSYTGGQAVAMHELWAKMRA